MLETVWEDVTIVEALSETDRDDWSSDNDGGLEEVASDDNLDPEADEEAERVELMEMLSSLDSI